MYRKYRPPKMVNGYVVEGIGDESFSPHFKPYDKHKLRFWEKMSRKYNKLEKNQKNILASSRYLKELQDLKKRNFKHKRRSLRKKYKTQYRNRIKQNERKIQELERILQNSTVWEPKKSPVRKFGESDEQFYERVQAFKKSEKERKELFNKRQKEKKIYNIEPQSVKCQVTESDKGICSSNWECKGERICKNDVCNGIAGCQNDFKLQNNNTQECMQYEANLKDYVCTKNDDCRGYRICKYDHELENRYCRGQHYCKPSTDNCTIVIETTQVKRKESEIAKIEYEYNKEKGGLEAKIKSFNQRNKIFSNRIFGAQIDKLVDLENLGKKIADNETLPKTNKVIKLELEKQQKQISQMQLQQGQPKYVLFIDKIRKFQTMMDNSEDFIEFIENFDSITKEL